MDSMMMCGCKKNSFPNEGNKKKYIVGFMRWSCMLKILNAGQCLCYGVIVCVDFGDDVCNTHGKTSP